MLPVRDFVLDPPATLKATLPMKAHPLAMMLAATAVLAAGTARAMPPADPTGIWTLQEENSTVSATQPTDRLYVNGLRVGWVSPTDAVPHSLAELGHQIWGEGQQRVGIDLQQQMYTPTNTGVRVPDPHDRPYAGYLTSNLSLLSDTDTTRSVLILSLGVVGPASGAENLQDGFHALIGQERAKGWNGQVQNTPALELQHERIWRLPIGTVAGLETDVLPAVTIGVGDVRDYVLAGATFRIGEGLTSDFGVPRVRPGLNGGDAFVPTRPFAWYVFGGIDGQAVGYDLLLQSAPFRGGPNVNVTRDVGELQGGVVLFFRGVRLTVSYVAQTQEFEGQHSGLHQFGSAALSVRF
jgi:hypothetical protein